MMLSISVILTISGNTHVIPTIMVNPSLTPEGPSVMKSAMALVLDKSLMGSAMAAVSSAALVLRLDKSLMESAMAAESSAALVVVLDKSLMSLMESAVSSAMAAVS